jgi:molybdate transport system substrate-binding protein
MRVYARGALVLWHVSAQPVLVHNLLSLLQAHEKIALPNPRHAPFGQRAMEAMTYHFSEYQWTKEIQPHVIYADNVMQAAHYALSGHVRYAWLPLSVVLAPGLRTYGNYTTVPEHTYQPIVQGACALRTNDARLASVAKDFVEFLAGEDAHAIFRQFGYRLP